MFSFSLVNFKSFSFASNVKVKLFGCEKYSSALLFQRIPSMALCGVASEMYLNHQKAVHCWCILTHTLSPHSSVVYFAGISPKDKSIAPCRQKQ